MNGCVIPHTPIAVDFWKARNSCRAKIFFLSHMHADHTCGLSSSWQLPIYCSEISKRLLIYKFQIQESLIQVLEANCSYIIPLDAENSETMTVSTIDANHCPGSLMFLFEGYFGRVLYTGDFRYTPEMFVDSPLTTTKTIDVLYLDNTYCSPKCVFPPRDEAKAQIIQLIEDHPEDNVLIGIRQLGKEDLLADLAVHFSTRVVVTQEKYEQLKLLEAPNVFSTDFDAGFIYAVPHYQITEKVLTVWNTERPTIGLVISALYSGIHNEQTTSKIFVHSVSYSDHSSYQELQEFVRKVRPKSVLPIVKMDKHLFGVDVSDRENMKCFDRYLDPAQAKQFEIPESVERFMAANSHPLDQLSFAPCPRTLQSEKVHRKPLYQSTQRKNSCSKGIVFLGTPVKQWEETSEDTESGEQLQVSDVNNIENENSSQGNLPENQHRKTGILTEVVSNTPPVQRCKKSTGDAEGNHSQLNMVLEDRSSENVAKPPSKRQQRKSQQFNSSSDIIMDITDDGDAPCLVLSDSISKPASIEGSDHACSEEELSPVPIRPPLKRTDSHRNSSQTKMKQTTLVTHFPVIDQSFTNDSNSSLKQARQSSGQGANHADLSRPDNSKAVQRSKFTNGYDTKSKSLEAMAKVDGSRSLEAMAKVDGSRSLEAMAKVDGSRSLVAMAKVDERSRSSRTTASHKRATGKWARTNSYIQATRNCAENEKALPLKRNHDHLDSLIEAEAKRRRSKRPSILPKGLMRQKFRLFKKKTPE